MRLVALIVIVVSPNYIDKTVMCLGKGARIKREDKDLLRYLVVVVDRCDKDTKPGSVVEIMHD